MAIPVNFAFLVPQAIIKGLAKLVFCVNSASSRVVVSLSIPQYQG